MHLRISPAIIRRFQALLMFRREPVDWSYSSQIPESAIMTTNLITQGFAKEQRNQ